MFKLIINYDNKKYRFLNIHNIFTGLPIILDMFLLFLNSKKEISIPFLIVNIIIGLLFIVEPFYKLTQVVFHILIIVQNYYICLSSIN